MCTSRRCCGKFLLTFQWRYSPSGIHLRMVFSIVLLLSLYHSLLSLNRCLKKYPEMNKNMHLPNNPRQVNIFLQTVELNVHIISLPHGTHAASQFCNHIIIALLSLQWFQLINSIPVQFRSAESSKNNQANFNRSPWYPCTDQYQIIYISALRRNFIGRTLSFSRTHWLLFNLHFGQLPNLALNASPNSDHCSLSSNEGKLVVSAFLSSFWRIGFTHLMSWGFVGLSRGDFVLSLSQNQRFVNSWH